MSTRPARTTKKKTKATAPAAANWSHVYPGSPPLTVGIIDAELAAALQHAKMALSDDPELRADGLEAMRRTAEIVAGAKLQKALAGARGGRQPGSRKAEQKTDGTPNVSDRTLRRLKSQKKRT